MLQLNCENKKKLSGNFNAAVQFFSSFDVKAF